MTYSNLDRAFDNWFAEPGEFTDEHFSVPISDEVIDYRALVSDDAVDMPMWLSLHSPSSDDPASNGPVKSTNPWAW